MSKRPARPSPVADAARASCWMLSRSSGPTSERLRAVKRADRVRAQGHPSPSVKMNRIRLPSISHSRGPPRVVLRKRAAPNVVWSQKYRRLRARYQNQQSPRVNGVRTRASTKRPNSPPLVPSKSNLRLPNHEGRVRKGWGPTANRGDQSRSVSETSSVLTMKNLTNSHAEPRNERRMPRHEVRLNR